ncbi:MAG TPA: type II secretion system F family protein [Streptosporangiaceae bacterium]|jgi:tight adherence protein C
MSGPVLLAAGLAALGLAIALLVAAVIPGRSADRGVAHALAAIERGYSRRSADQGADEFILPGWLRSLALRLSPSGIAAKLQRRLDLAGNPGRWTPDRILAAKGLGLIALAMLGALFGLHNPGLLILCAAVGGACGFFLPDILLYNSGQKRQARIQVALPDALDMLTVCVEAGLGFDAALAQVARNTDGPLAAEFARALQEMQIGKSRSQALRALADRTTVPEARAFISALVQASDLGIPVARVLREQAKEMRVRRRQRAEGKAQQVPVKITFPLILCIFPALLVIILGPGVINIAHALFGR